VSVVTNSERAERRDPAPAGASSAVVGARLPGKRDRLVAAARELIYRRGAARTSLADIAEAAEVPVGNVYYYFKTKDEIIGAVVHTYEDQLRSTLAELERRHRRPKARLKALVGVLAGWAAESVARYGAQYGCPHGTLSSELAKRADGPDPLAATLIRIPLTWAEQQFREMGRRDAHDLAVELVAAYQGSAVLTSTLGQPEIMARQAERLDGWIDTLDGESGSQPGTRVERR
jgi:TetR/AcrR family transcriptional regulator, transcriptional repressor for nem operon